MSEKYEYRVFGFYMGTPKSKKDSEDLMNLYGEDGWLFTPIEQTYYSDGSQNNLVMLGRRVKQQPSKNIYNKV